MRFICVLLIFYPFIFYSQSPDKSIVLDSLFQVKVNEFTKKFKSENIVIIGDDLGNIFLVNEEGRLYKSKENCKGKYRKKNKLKLYHQKLSNDFSWMDYKNPECSEDIRRCIFLIVGYYNSDKKKLKVNSFFIPIDHKINPDINQITELYFMIR